jgi:hypothetical protein
VKLVITEEDHRFIESIVERFDPAKLIKRQDGVSDEDWAIFTETFRVDLREEIRAAMINRALNEADLRVEVSNGDGYRDVSEYGATRDAYERALNNVTEAFEGEFTKPFIEETERVIEAVKVGAGV